MSTLHTASVLEFRKNIYKHIKSLPLEVTAKGRVIFKVVSPNEVPVLDKVATAPPLEQAIKKTEKKIKEFNSANFARPMICPKHGGQLLGGKYTCCEKVPVL